MCHPVDESDGLQRPASGMYGDLAFFLVFAIAWVVYVTPIVVGEQRRGGDIFRDVASAVNVQHGRILADPAYRDEWIWYPPLSPAVMAGCASLFEITPADCYRWSQLVFNWLIPAGLYVLVRLWWGRRAAAGAVIALLLALPWWQCEVVQGQPSVHAVVWAWAALLLYARQHRTGSMRWALACGAFLGLSFWHHPLIPAVLAAAVACTAALEYARLRTRSADGASARSFARRNLAMLALTVVVAAPMLCLMLHGPVLNRAPREFMMPELWTAEFALMHLNPWIWIMGVFGLAASVRRNDLWSRLLMVTLAICVLGQVPAYLRHFGPSWAAALPVVVPHELQWTFQLGWAISVGIGIDRTLTALAERLGPLRRSPPAVAALTALALVLTGVWGMPEAPRNLRRFLHEYAANFPDATRWIRENTEIDDVFACEMYWAFAWLNPDTGRKVWITAPGHSNPRVDWEARKRVLDELADAPTPHAFWQGLRRCGIDYCIISPGWAPKVLADPVLGPRTVPDYLCPVFVSDKLHILKVVEKPPADRHGGAALGHATRRCAGLWHPWRVSAGSPRSARSGPRRQGRGRFG